VPTVLNVTSVRAPRILLTAAVAAFGLLLSGCATAASSASAPSASASGSASQSSSGSAGVPATSASPSATNPYGTVTVDPPGPNDPVLTVSGGTAGTVSFTVRQLEALGLTTVTVSEPFVKKQETFTGVPMSAVLTKAGIPSGARIDTVALNDYHYANVSSAFSDSSGLIATRVGAGPVPFDAGGPIRLVFPDGSALSTVLDAWNWSLATITVTTSDTTG